MSSLVFNTFQGRKENEVIEPLSHVLSIELLVAVDDIDPVLLTIKWLIGGATNIRN
jgi:hypothetical protein